METALAGWNDWVGAGKATVDQERAVKAAFQKYQGAQLVLLDAAIAYKQAQQATDASGVSTAQAPGSRSPSHNWPMRTRSSLVTV